MSKLSVLAVFLVVALAFVPLTYACNYGGNDLPQFNVVQPLAYSQPVCVQQFAVAQQLPAQQFVYAQQQPVYAQQLAVVGNGCGQGFSDNNQRSTFRQRTVIRQSSGGGGGGALLLRGRR